jgi:enoyl-CoA hydratase
MAPVLVERRGQVQVVTINRPEARNAVDLAVAQGIAAALDELDASGELRAAVLTGAGGSFSAGMDLKAFLRGELPVAGDRGFAGITRRAARKPLLAAVEGAALGGGLEIVLACDLVVASATASFGLPEVRRALIAGAGALIRLPRRLPYHVAMELALTGEPLPAERAAALGLVNRLVAPGRALEAALELAALVVRGGPLACEASKRILAGAVDAGEAEAWRQQDQLLAEVAASHDAREGARAFAEKRAPVWQGR